MLAASSFLLVAWSYLLTTRVLLGLRIRAPSPQGISALGSCVGQPSCLLFAALRRGSASVSFALISGNHSSNSTVCRNLNLPRFKSAQASSSRRAGGSNGATPLSGSRPLRRGSDPRPARRSATPRPRPPPRLRLS